MIVCQNGWFIKENPIKMDDVWVSPFMETSKSAKYMGPIYLFSLWIRRGNEVEATVVPKPWFNPRIHKV